MEVYAWAEEQGEKNRRAFYRLLEEGRKVWTPGNIFNQCCVKWLVDGPRCDDEYGYFDEYSPRNGCSGGCNRAHPHIKLRFDDYTKVATATLSHPLDPFANYFRGLVEEGKAKSLSLSVYQLDGYLRPIEAALYADNSFGNHLIKVEQGSREASDAAQSAKLEDERKSKRPRLKSAEDDAATNAVCSPDTFERVMNIVFQHELVEDYLQNDPVALYCMRPVCKLFRKLAMGYANEKMKTLDFSVTSLVNGTGRYGEYKLDDGYDTETYDADYGGFDGDEPLWKYEKKDEVSFAYSERGDEGGYFPVDNDGATFSWNSGELRRDLLEEDEADHEDASHATYAYRGQMLRVYWHPKEEDPVESTERDDSLYWGGGEEKPNLGIRVLQLGLGMAPDRGIVSKSGNGVTIKYEVLESNAAGRTEEVAEASGGDDEDEELSGNSYDGAPMRYVTYSGRIRLIKLEVDFGVLVREHAVKVENKLSAKHRHILKERPLTKAEKRYKELVAKARDGYKDRWFT